MLCITCPFSYPNFPSVISILDNTEYSVAVNAEELIVLLDNKYFVAVISSPAINSPLILGVSNINSNTSYSPILIFCTLLIFATAPDVFPTTCVFSKSNIFCLAEVNFTLRVFGIVQAPVDGFRINSEGYKKFIVSLYRILNNILYALSVPFLLYNSLIFLTINCLFVRLLSDISLA